MTRRLLSAAVAAAALFAPIAAQAPAAGAGATPGAQTSGDSFFPDMGNGGYDVRAYQVSLRFDPTTQQIDAECAITMVAHQDLSELSLDLSGLSVNEVTVDGTSAVFTRSGHKLVITPATPLAADDVAVVGVEYSGVPQPITDPDASLDGWLRLSTGVVTLNEPNGAMTWMPVNNTLRDRAVFSFEVTAPAALRVSGSGTFHGRRVIPGGLARTTWTTGLIPPHATSIAIAPMRVVRDTVAGRPWRSYLSSGSDTRLPGWSEKAMTWMQRRVGRYPFGSGGLTALPGVPYALEVAARPVVSPDASRATVVHEYAHQWFGDTVVPADWSDIWLSEGLATYFEWIERDRRTPGFSLRQFRNLYANPPASEFWTPAPAALPGPTYLFDNAVYERGAMTLIALRAKIGPTTMSRLLRTWYSANARQNVTTAQFVSLAESISGQDLSGFFDEWLYAAAKPGAPSPPMRKPGVDAPETSGRR